MAGHLRTVTGPFRDDIGTVADIIGSGYLIGDGLTLTAGHIVYEWNRTRSNVSISDIIDGNISVALDYRSYRVSYFSQVQAVIAAGASDENEVIEARIHASDSVLIDGGSNVTASADGLVTFLDSSDLANVTSSLGSAQVLREGLSTGLVAGTVTSVGGGSSPVRQGRTIGRQRRRILTPIRGQGLGHRYTVVARGHSRFEWQRHCVW